MTTRREFLALSATACGVGLTSVADALSPEPKRTAVGLASNVFDQRRAAGGDGPDIADPLTFLRESYALGAGGIQGPLGIRDEQYCQGLAAYAHSNGMYIEASIMPPRDAAAVERFEKEIVTAKSAGAALARSVVFPGRRYETFTTAAQYVQAARRAKEMLELAEPVLRRQKFRLAIENHKDQRVAERLELFKQLDSEWIGACVDVGNSFALCEDPLEVVRAYAPLAWTVHLKDQALGPCEDGFLFADAPLGRGFLDLKQIVQVLREANPQVRFNLEVMTRDPLRVPVLRSEYWASMPGVPASELARTMRVVKEHAAPELLERVSILPPRQRVEVETRNITRSLAYACEVLKL
jgi:sugar phosphate isomerase/epimerase